MRCARLALNAIEGAPWAEISYGKPLTQTRLSAMLVHFDIRPKQAKIGGVNRRGYQRDQFDAVFAAYFPPNTLHTPFQTATAATALKNREKNAFQIATSDLPGSGLKGEICIEEQTGSGGSTLKGDVDAIGHGGRLSDGLNGGARCAHCGQPGGIQCAYDGQTFSLHPKCQPAWKEAYDADRTASMEAQS